MYKVRAKCRLGGLRQKGIGRVQAENGVESMETQQGQGRGEIEANGRERRQELTRKVVDERRSEGKS